MSRRSSSKATRDDAAFPIRVKFMVPKQGFGNDLVAFSQWLNADVGPTGYAIHNAPTVAGVAIGLHVRSLDVAARFIEAFPDLVLADRVDLEL